MTKLDKLSRLRSLRRKVAEQGHTGVVLVEPEELQALSEAKKQAAAAPDSADPAPGHFDGMRNAEEYQPAELVEYTPPTPGPDAPLTDEEKKYAQHGDLLTIFAENPEEVPPRIRARAARLLELREEMSRPNPWAWMT